MTHTKNFKFMYEDYEDEETKERYRNDPVVTLELLNEVGWALYYLSKRFDSGSVVLFSEVCFSKEMWDALNYARLWPESFYPEVNELLEDALGNVSTAHAMIEEVYAVGVKKINRAYLSIIIEVREALANIKKAIILVDNYVADNLGGKDGDDSSPKQQC